jgi:DNA replication protein DnaC
VPPVRDLNPHMRPRSGSDYPCPHGLCGGEGFILDEETNTARPCECRVQRITNARTHSLDHKIPKKFQQVGFDRWPVTEMDASVVREVRSYCNRISERIGKGQGIWFSGERGTGKTTLAMLISQHALRARHSVAIYTAPKLLAEIRNTYEDDATQSYDQLMEQLRAVDLLHIEDLAVARTTDWVLEQFYTVVNDRYQEEKAIMFTADVHPPGALAEHVGARTYSRLYEMCGDPIPMYGADQRLQRYGVT